MKYIVENGARVLPVEVIARSYNLIMVRLPSGQVIRIPSHRLFDSPEEADKSIHKPQIKRTPYDFGS